ncbi:MAG TPA: EAL domain-containing response regulator [Chroococcidiopsis sp.]
MQSAVVVPTILVIEDETSIRETVVDLLEFQGFQTLSAANGKEGIAIAAQHQPDLILCDIEMPELDGYGVLEALRQNLKTAATPLIFLTARVTKPDVRRAMILGADDYLTKPFSPDEVLEAIQTRLSRHQAIANSAGIATAPLDDQLDAKAAELTQALERSEFVLYYQPQVSLKTGQWMGAEVLLRWQHPQRGLVPPMDFIPLAEQTGLIVPIGMWVLQQACDQLKTWQQYGLNLGRLAVNVSSLQLNQDQFGQQVVDILNKTSLSPSMLELELTESLVVQNVDATIARLAEFRRLGLRVAIDDFGTGYASLGYLKHFPFDTLKIDRCFVQNLDQDERNGAIATAIIQMAHSLNLSVLAEGVETTAERDFLMQQGCDDIQGYLVSRPLPADQLRALLDR